MIETYNQIHDSLYAPNSTRTVARLDPIDRKAWAVMQALSSRKGFDWWWDDIAIEDQDEIFNEIREAIRGNESLT